MKYARLLLAFLFGCFFASALSAADKLPQARAPIVSTGAKTAKFRLECLSKSLSDYSETLARFAGTSIQTTEAFKKALCPLENAVYQNNRAYQDVADDSALLLLALSNSVDFNAEDKEYFCRISELPSFYELNVRTPLNVLVNSIVKLQNAAPKGAGFTESIADIQAHSRILSTRLADVSHTLGPAAAGGCPVSRDVTSCD